VLIRFLENEATRAEHWQSAVEALAPVLPRDRALGPIVLPILKKTQFPMDGKNPGGEPLVLGLANADHQNIAITATACAQMLIESDRTLIELPHLIEATSREYPRYVRLCALAVLPQFGAEASSAVASLEKLLSDDDVAIRAFAVIASAQIDGNAKQARLRLKESKLEGEDARLVQESVDGWFEQLNQLSRIPEPEPPEGIEEGGMPFELEIYLDQAKSPHGFHRRAAIREIAKMGRAAKPALPALRDLLKHSEEATRQLAADAIRKIESDR
jgi:HEAT repeat protein